MTNDPNLASILMPLGGAKGSSLSLMFECLVSLMGSNPLIASLIMPGADPSGFRQNGLAIAIKISAFIDISNYRNEVDLLASAIKSSLRAEGVDEIYAPGERGDAILTKRLKYGIPLPKGTWDRLSQSASTLGVDMPNSD